MEPLQAECTRNHPIGVFHHPAAAAAEYGILNSMFHCVGLVAFSFFDRNGLNCHENKFAPCRCMSVQLLQMKVIIIGVGAAPAGPVLAGPLFRQLNGTH